MLPRAHFSTIAPPQTQGGKFKTPLKIQFDADGRFHLYHAEEGEQFLKRLTRVNMLFTLGNSMLLIAEVMNPFFGYYHSLSLTATVLLSLTGSRMLDYYSRRMINNLWLHKDGKTVEIDYMSAFFLPRSEKYMCRNFGNYQPSRLFNVNLVQYQALQSIYINPSRNTFKSEEHAEIIQAIMAGKEINLAASHEVGPSQRRSK